MMKWFLSDVAYAVWLAFDHPEYWKRTSSDEWTYKKRIVLWVSDSQFRLWQPDQYTFGFIDKRILRRKFNRMQQKLIIGKFTEALLE